MLSHRQRNNLTDCGIKYINVDTTIQIGSINKLIFTKNYDRQCRPIEHSNHTGEIHYKSEKTK